MDADLTSDQLLQIGGYLIPILSAAISYKVLSVTNTLKDQLTMQIDNLKEEYHQDQLKQQAVSLRLETEISMIKVFLDFHFKKRSNVID